MQVNVSHNRIPFVTKKMFPESRWIPYKLESVDLSHNSMPVLTRELLIGTGHLRHLNVSHNRLNDLRAGVLPNLTSLETLDLSDNELEDKVVLDRDRLGPLPNLTSLSLAGNRITELPIEVIVRMSGNLTLLDVSRNGITLYYPELTPMIKDGGLVVRLEGNPLHCNCYLRPVAYWLASQGRVRGRGEEWDRAECADPPYLSGAPVGALIEEQLICEDSDEAQRFRLNPDIKFRQVTE